MPERGRKERKERGQGPERRPARGRAAVPAVKIDGEAIIDKLRLAVRDIASLGSSPAESWQPNPLLDKVFVFIIREFLRRNNRASRAPAQSGGGGEKAAYDQVVSGMRALYSSVIPVSSGSEASCIAAYKNRRMLGRGEYGTTYAFDDLGARATLALKVIHFSPHSDPRKYQNILSEIEIQRDLGEKGVAPRIHGAHYCYENGGVTMMIVMDLMTLGDVDHFSETRALTDEHRAEMLRKVRVMHDAGYIHNDLHSGNVFVTDNPKGGYDFYIGDFGFAHKAPDDEREAQTLRDKDINHIMQVVSFVNRDLLRGLLYGMMRDGVIDVSVDMRVSHAAVETDWDSYDYVNPAGPLVAAAAP